ncbi:DUF4905 domain-containing protein [Mucilaginibacter terrenus]|nr:DUF4905 domain-containing protein [Mucilaginibacter terrenus]
MDKLLAPLLAHCFTAPVWRMEIDELSDAIVLELRSEAEKQVSFASLSLTTGQVNFKNYLTEERWLVGLEALYNGVALLHYYKNENSPEHKGIIAIDAQTGTNLWANYSFAFDGLTPNGLAAYNTALQPKKTVLLDIATGAVLRNCTPADKPLTNNIVVPSMISAQQLPQHSLPLQPYGNMVHYLHHNKYIIVSLHTFENGVLQQHMFIMDGANIVYRDVLNSGIQKLQPEAFVLHKNVLVYIKNKTELKAVRL